MDDRKVVREYLESLVIAVLIALFLRTFVIGAYKIPTGSMAPTLKAGDLIFAWRFPYGFRIPFTKVLLVKPKTPNRGDVILFRYPEDESISFIKRVVGLPGDTIKIRAKRLYINGVLQSYAAADQSHLNDLAFKNISIVEKESIENSPHLVMFRRDTDDDDSYGPTVVPNGKLFVLGDNRDSSDDSRYWGMVPLENLEGRAFLIWFSLDWENRTKWVGTPKLRSERLFAVIH